MKRTDIKYFIFGLTVLGVFCFAGCNQNSNAEITNTANNSTANGNANKISNRPTTANIDGTPAAVATDYRNALGKKDVEALKKTLSKAALTWFEGKAKKNKMSLDEFLQKLGEGVGEESKVEFLNKSSNDKTAMVCLQDKETGEKSIYPTHLVKESGEWKLEVHKTYQYMELQDEMRESGSTETQRKAFEKASKMLNEGTCH